MKRGCAAMKTMIVFTAQDGSEWAFPATVVADHRARHYAASDPDTTYQEEFENTMQDQSELIDWVLNNMGFEDFERHIVPYCPAPKPDLKQAWEALTGGDMVKVAEAPRER